MANNTDWLNISQMTGGTGETALSLTALTNNSLQPKTATITARNTQYNVSDTTTVTIQGFQPTLTLSRSTLRFDSTGGTATFTVYSNTAWTINFPAIVHSYSTSAGTGDTEVTVVLAPNPDEVAKVDTGIVKDVFNVNQLYLTIVQESFIVELYVEPDDDIIFANTGSSTSITIDSNADWELEYPSWVTPSITSGESGTTTVTFTAGQNGPTDRSGEITVYAGSKYVTINVFQPFYIPPYITVTPSAWTFNYTEDGKTFIVDSYPEWTAEVISTGETIWSSDVYMEATFDIPSAMTMPLYTSSGDTTYIYFGPVKVYGSSVTFESAGTYKIRYEITSGGTVPSLSGNTYLTNLHFTENIGVIPAGAFSGCSALSGIVSDCVIAPSVATTSFYGVATGGTLLYPEGSNYNSWLSPAQYFLGYYGWPGFSGKTYMLIEYNVTSTTQPTKIYYTNKDGNNNDIFTAITLENGETVPFNTGYTFSQTGSNKLKFYLRTNVLSAYLFSACTDIISAELADTTTVLGNCFKGCSYLSSLTLNNGIETIEEIHLPALTGLTIPSSVATLGSLSSCSTLTSINIPDSVTAFTGGFDGCSALTTVSFGSGITSLGGTVFLNCPSLTTVNLSRTITSLGNNCFLNCASLSSIDLTYVEEIGSNCFSGCASLGPQLVLNDITLSEGCFRDCTGIEQLYVRNIANIPPRAFQNCSSLYYVLFDDALSYIQYRAFQDCGSVTSITSMAVTEPTVDWGTYALDVGRNGILYYPAGSDYSDWLSTKVNRLGGKGWTGQEINIQQ